MHPSVISIIKAHRYMWTDFFPLQLLIRFIQPILSSPIEFLTGVMYSKEEASEGLLEDVRSGARYEDFEKHTRSRVAPLRSLFVALGFALSLLGNAFLLYKLHDTKDDPELCRSKFSKYSKLSRDFEVAHARQAVLDMTRHQCIVSIQTIAVTMRHLRIRCGIKSTPVQ